jgi:hypothetical protein
MHVWYEEGQVTRAMYTPQVEFDSRSISLSHPIRHMDLRMNKTTEGFYEIMSRIVVYIEYKLDESGYLDEFLKSFRAILDNGIE